MRTTQGRRRAAVVSTLAGLLGATLLGPAVAPAQARDVAAPLAADDTASVYFGQTVSVPVLRNDVDPQGESLAVCRASEAVGALNGLDVDTSVVDGRLVVSVYGGFDGRPVDVTLTYQACNSERLSAPATVTLTVQDPERLVVEKLDRPGRVRFTNPNDLRVVVLYGDPRRARPEGRLRLGAGESGVVRTRATRLHYVALSPRQFLLVDQGLVRGIEQRTTASGPTGPDGEMVPQRAQRLWSATR
ncbi:Ig-like domain-containing protein [Nocardioides kribbensis]|uniref:Ig-like domain-containing protein n=1 Tax=Nocardioides kribbensis TaxID=305517 RepID=UPI001879ACAB|nr:hypothetical protein [Nocardioides kribbensis]